LPRIKEIPDFERPREKARRLGIQTLSNAELLALIIGSGYVGRNAIDVANDLLRDSGGLFNLFQKNDLYQIKIKGIGPNCALRIGAALELSKRYKTFETYNDVALINPDLIFRRYHPQIVGLSQEVLIVVILNRKHQVVFEETLYKGTGKSVEISIKDILKCLLIHNGYHFYLIHNHPSGSLSPSAEDIVMTDLVNRETERLGLKMIDHLIISNSGYYSFAHNSTLILEKEEI